MAIIVCWHYVVIGMLHLTFWDPAYFITISPFFILFLVLPASLSLSLIFLPPSPSSFSFLPLFPREHSLAGRDELSWPTDQSLALCGAPGGTSRAPSCYFTNNYHFQNNSHLVFICTFNFTSFIIAHARERCRRGRLRARAPISLRKHLTVTSWIRSITAACGAKGTAVSGGAGRGETWKTYKNRRGGHLFIGGH